MAGGRTILIVDDDAAVRTIMASVLQNDGYIVIQAGQADEALALSTSNTIDAFLLDIEIGNRSGIDLCRTIRNLNRYHNTPIIFLTGMDIERSFAQAYAA